MTAPAYACPATITGPSVRVMVRFRAAASSLSDVNGIGAAITFKPRSSSERITACQLEPSAHAPWTTTTVAFFGKLMMLLLSRVQCRRWEEAVRLDQTSE